MLSALRVLVALPGDGAGLETGVPRRRAILPAGGLRATASARFGSSSDGSFAPAGAMPAGGRRSTAVPASGGLSERGFAALPVPPVGVP